MTTLIKIVMLASFNGADSYVKGDTHEFEAKDAVSLVRAKYGSVHSESADDYADALAEIEAAEAQASQEVVADEPSDAQGSDGKPGTETSNASTAEQKPVATAKKGK